MRLQSILKNWKISKFLTNKSHFFSRKKILKHLPKPIIDKAYYSKSKWNR